jgi:DNA-binding Lrp family transcriptional regulator
MGEIIDDMDKEIIGELKKDSRQSVIKLAKKLKLPATTVHYRFTRMMQRKVLRFTVNADREYMGRPMVGYVLIKAMPGVDQAKLFKEITAHPSIEEGSVITGEFDMLLKISVKDIQGLDAVVLRFLRTNKSIAETRTMLAYTSVEK